MTEEQIKLLEDWADAKLGLAKIKLTEAELRIEVRSSFFPVPEIGTNTIELEGGWKLKCVEKLSYTIDKASLHSTLEQLPEGIADRVIQYKPSLDMSQYNKLSDYNRGIFDSALIIKPASPTITLVEPKEKK